MSEKADQYSEQETARRMDDALCRALKMPPRPHKAAQSDKKRGGDRRQPKKAS